MGNRVRRVLETVRSPTLSSSKVDRVDQTSDSGSDFDRATACVVENTELESPAVRVPYIVGDNVVYDRAPCEGEGNDREDATALASCSNGNCRDETCKHLLVDGIHDSRDLFLDVNNRSGSSCDGNTPCYWHLG